MNARKHPTANDEPLLDAIGVCLAAGEEYISTADDADDYDEKRGCYAAAIHAVAEMPCVGPIGRLAKLELMRDNLDDVWGGVAYRGGDPRAALDLMVELG